MKRNFVIEYDDDLIDPTIAFETVKGLLDVDEQEQNWVTGIFASDQPPQTISGLSGRTVCKEIR